MFFRNLLKCPTQDIKPFHHKWKSNAENDRLLFLWVRGPKKLQISASIEELSGNHVVWQYGKIAQLPGKLKSYGRRVPKNQSTKRKPYPSAHVLRSCNPAI